MLPSRHGPQLKRQVIEWVERESIIITDDWPAYNGLQRHFIDDSRINHSTGMYVEALRTRTPSRDFLGTSSRRSEGTRSARVPPLSDRGP